VVLRPACRQSVQRRILKETGGGRRTPDPIDNEIGGQQPSPNQETISRKKANRSASLERGQGEIVRKRVTGKAQHTMITV